MATHTGKGHRKTETRGSSDVEMTHTHTSSDRAASPRPGAQSTHPASALMRQMQNEADRWFGRFGMQNWASPDTWLAQVASQAGNWTPAIDAFQRGNEFVIRADVPGMNRHDLSVEVGDNAITIRGERKHEDNEERDGVFWSERSYGSFCRVVPIPPGTIGESAKAIFTNGVLEIVLSAPSQEARRGRKIDISGSREETNG